MDGAFFGEIRMFAGTFAPKDWALCEGQTLNISANTALFSVIGNQFGGDGVRTFGLPDLRSRLTIGAGAGGGLTPQPFGTKGGSPTYTLDRQSTPSHSHTMNAALNLVNTTSPANGFLGSNAPRTTARFKSTAPTAPAVIAMAATCIKASGDAIPVSNMQPSLTVTFIICTSGMLPPRQS